MGSRDTILQLHRLSRGNVWDAGQYKDKPVDIIEKLPGGGERVRFRSVSPADTPDFTRRLVSLWKDQSRDRDISPLIVMAAFNLDFLCIHPFRDGNGRVSRLLLLLTAYHLGLEVGRYISLERIIEENKERYYETLQQSSQGWHEGKHDPWPYIGYLLFTLKRAYEEFEERVGKTGTPRGEKTALVEAGIAKQVGPFSVSDIRDACPGVGIDLIRKVMNSLKGKEIECLGRGQSAQWRRVK
jgi:Fic family protein